MTLVEATETMIDLKSYSKTELEQLVQELGHPTYRGRQIYRWLYGHGASRYEDMANIPASLRQQLAETFFLPNLTKKSQQKSDDGTIKTLYQLSSGRAIETVLIPEIDDVNRTKRITVCVSSQVGCAMDCSFCATGKMGFKQNLSSGEIFDQVFLADRLARDIYERGLTNIVFMGMGEPLLNVTAVLDAVEKISSPDGLAMSPRRITISTVGLANQIIRLADASPNTNLAVSLHAPTDQKRSSIMPVNRKTKTDLKALKSAIEYYARKTKSPVTYEYCLFKDFNDSVEDAKMLAEVVRWAPSKVNLIMYNPVEGVSFKRTSETTVERFMKTLADLKVSVTLRRSRGQDIDAACGQLAIR